MDLSCLNRMRNVTTVYWEHLMQRAYVFFGKSINLNRHAFLDTCASYLYILVGHRVMVGLNIFVRDIIPWDSCSQMEVFPDYKTDP